MCCLLTIASQEVCGKYRADGVGMGTADPWQVDVIKLLPSSEGYKYAITCVGMATGLLAVYPACQPDQKVVIVVLEHFCAAYE